MLNGSDEVFFAFFAGYVDAEGYFRAYFVQTSQSPWHVSRFGLTTLSY